MAEFDYSIVKDPSVFKVNCLPAHSDHVPLAPEDDLNEEATSLRLSLNGMWRFRYSDNYESAPKGFEKPEYDVSGWKEIRVPSNMQFEGYDRPAYVNTQYPWDGVEDIEPGQIPEKFNPVGQYVRFFRIPESWKGREIRISFQGVESGFALWLNGQYVGYSEDSFTPSEFDLTPYLQEGVNRLAVLDFKWTSGSWCEDQDMYRLSGIFRDVFLYMVPCLHLEDVKIREDYDRVSGEGLFSADLKLSGDIENGEVEWQLERLGVIHAWDDLKKMGMIAASGVCKRVPDAAERSAPGAAVSDGSAAGQAECPCAEAAVKTSWLHIEEQIESALAWSAEIPNLYRLTLTLKVRGEAVEAVRELVGFRHFEMKDGIMCLNGKRIVFCGVNRHEFSCDFGRRARVEDVLHDVTVMKRSNINAVRTCHYPDASILYRLCDIFGLYMIAENNMETHGMWEKIARGQAGIEGALPGDREEWFPMLSDRLHTMYELDKNHPAILIWSCGNESFGGSVIWKMSQEFRRLDPARLVHYEGIRNDRRYPDTSDMESQMYTPVREIEEFLKEHPEKPFILCEYAHAMGNSCGDFYKYTDLAKREKRYQGGFIWDFIDQAVRMKDRYGEEFQGYGGDNLERPTDYEFSGNGILDSKRKPYGGKMQEVRHCYQPLDIEVGEEYVTVTNRNLFLSSSAYDCTAKLSGEGRILQTVPLRADLTPGESRKIRLPFEIPDAGEYVISVSFTLKDDQIWGKAGSEIAYGEAVISRKGSLPESLEQLPKDVDEDGDSFALNGISVSPVMADHAMKVIRGTVNTGVSGEHFSALFSNLKGGLTSYRYGGRELIGQIPRPNFWRAPTSNDEGNQMAARYGIWKNASLYQHFIAPEQNPYEVQSEAHRYPVVEEKEDCVDISWKKYFPVMSGKTVLPEAGATGQSAGVASMMTASVLTTYRVFPDGTIRFIVTREPSLPLPPMPEFGWMFALDADYCHVKYYGMGPEENYCDRRKGSRLSVYERDVQDMMENYLVPQETGNRTGVRYAEITDHQGHGVRFTAAGFEDCGDPEASRPGTMEFSALPYSPEMLEIARHPYELPRQHHTYVRCSLKQMGVGGDDSWGARTHEEFLLKTDRKLQFAVDLRGI